MFELIKDLSFKELSRLLKMFNIASFSSDPQLQEVVGYIDNKMKLISKDMFIDMTMALRLPDVDKEDEEYENKFYIELVNLKEEINDSFIMEDNLKYIDDIMSKVYKHISDYSKPLEEEYSLVREAINIEDYDFFTNDALLNETSVEEEFNLAKEKIEEIDSYKKETLLSLRNFRKRFTSFIKRKIIPHGEYFNLETFSRKDTESLIKEIDLINNLFLDYDDVTALEKAQDLVSVQ
jgi:hypothetical protein